MSKPPNENKLMRMRAGDKSAQSIFYGVSIMTNRNYEVFQCLRNEEISQFLITRLKVLKSKSERDFLSMLDFL